MIQGSEGDDVVYTVQELGRELTVQGLTDHRIAAFLGQLVGIESHPGTKVLQLPRTDV